MMTLHGLRTLAGVAARVALRRSSSELTATERVAIVTCRLKGGDRLTLSAVCALVELSPSGARKMLARISRKVPIYCDGGLWQMCETKEG